MTETDFVQVLSLLFGAYGLGWGSGFLIYAIRRGMELLK